MDGLVSQAVDIVARYVQKLSHKRELQIRVTCIVMAIPSEYQNVISYLQARLRSHGLRLTLTAPAGDEKRSEG